MKLKDRTAIATGAASGIDKMFALRMAQDGANVIVADNRNRDAVAAEVAKATGANTLGLKIDVSVDADTLRTGGHSNAALCIGIIANPVSARDIRRIIANASNLQIADRVNIVLRVLTALAAMHVPRVLMMPDRGGIRAMLMRSLNRERNLHHAFPEVEFLDMEPM